MKKRHGKPYTCSKCGAGYTKLAPLELCDACWKAELIRLNIWPKPGRKAQGGASKVRVTITLDADLLAKVDQRAGDGQRSEFITEALKRRLP